MVYQQRFGQGSEENILHQVREGMVVHDLENEEIGTVRDVFFGDVGVEPGAEGRGAPTPVSREYGWRDSPMEFLAKAFTGDEEMEETIRQRLLRQGFVQIDGSGLFEADFFVLPDQIEAVEGDRVRLNVNRDELIQR
jgi:hypothetical protein